MTDTRADEKQSGSAQAKRKPGRAEGRNIVILCDGTGNELGRALSGDKNAIRISNVLKLFRIAEKGKTQLVYYTQGVGTLGKVDFLYRWKQKLLVFVGQTTGYGLDDNVLGAYRFLVEHYREGDRIFLFGFSRGAWAVRILAGLVHLVGLLRPDQINLAENALDTYKRSARENELRLSWHFSRYMGTEFPTIHFVGVWDSVASVLVPRSDRMWIPSLETLPYTETNPSVRTFRHALALDERRRMFRVAEWTQPQPFVANRFRPREAVPQDIEQRWFPGVHSDIGGGYREDESALSKAPLIWIVEEAVKAGLNITRRNLRELAHGEPQAGSEHVYSTPDPLGMMHRSLNRFWWILEVIPKNVKYREWRRRSFLRRYIPWGEPRAVQETHVVDPGVEARRAGDGAYRPPNYKS